MLAQYPAGGPFMIGLDPASLFTVDAGLWYVALGFKMRHTILNYSDQLDTFV